MAKWRWRDSHGNAFETVAQPSEAGEAPDTLAWALSNRGACVCACVRVCVCICAACLRLYPAAHMCDSRRMKHAPQLSLCVRACVYVCICVYPGVYIPSAAQVYTALVAPILLWLVVVASGMLQFKGLPENKRSVKHVLTWFDVRVFRTYMGECVTHTHTHAHAHTMQMHARTHTHTRRHVQTPPHTHGCALTRCASVRTCS